MKIVSYLNATVVYFISPDEFLPEGQNSLNAFAQAIAQRYGFRSQGQSEVAAAAGIISPVFHDGDFDFAGMNTPILSVEFQPTRLSIVCSKSDQANALLADLIDFLVKDFSFRRPSRAVEKYDISSIVVDFGEAFFSRIDAIDRIARLIEKSCSDILHRSIVAEPQGLRYSGSIQLGAGQNLGIHFVLEKRVGRPAGTNWLFSQAPIATEPHIALLTEIEKLVTMEVSE